MALIEDVEKLKGLNVTLNDTITQERAQFREIVLELRRTNKGLSEAFDVLKAKVDEFEAIDLSTEVAALESAVAAVSLLAEEASAEEVVSR